MLAGDVRARAAVREELPSELAGIVVETDRGGRGEPGSNEALTDQLLRIAAEHSGHHADEYTERFQAGLAHGQAVHGDQRVAQAAEMGAVQTLLFEPDSHPPRGAFLLKACTRTSSSVALVAKRTGLADGVGAVLRFTLPR